MPLLSITMPTRNRPELFERALSSVIQATASVAGDVEVTVSDGSDDDTTGRVVRRLLTDWPGGHRYIWNRPSLEMVENINRAVELASGEWIHQLHDDDYLLPNAGEIFLDAIHAASPGERVLLFGVEIVDAKGARQRVQVVRDECYLEPREALSRLLRNSSFVREPGVVAQRSAYEATGLFDTAAGGITDLDMWIQLFSRYGVRCVPHVTCAYTIHEAAATTAMWNADTIRVLCDIFDRAIGLGVVPERNVRRWESDFFHQFILAGAYRRLRRGRRGAARDVLRLFDLPEVRHLGPSPKWLAMRVALTAVTMGARSNLDLPRAVSE
jgi:glycosyltransferase involved in cell wall biosynthesis